MTAPFRQESETSLSAARAVPKKLSEAYRELVYRAIYVSGSKGMTDHELQAELGMDGNTERPRRVELVNRGRVFNSGRTRLTPSGRPATVWVVDLQRQLGF